MKPPTVSVVMCINERPPEVMDAVFRSLAGEPFDQMVIVMDRSPSEVTKFVRDFWYGQKAVNIVEIAGKPGWLCPAKAWNIGWGRVSSELTYCISSEVIQAAGNISRAREILSGPPAVLFGKAECSCGPEGTEVNWHGRAPGNLLVDAAHPRPLGFIMALPTWALRMTKGMDEGFMRGYWYDDDDLIYRLWRLGLPFVFDDSVSGVHQHHERASLTQEGIAINRAYILSKHGTEHPWSPPPPEGVTATAGRTVMLPADAQDLDSWWLTQAPELSARSV